MDSYNGLPCLQISQSLDKYIKVQSFGAVEVEFIPMRRCLLLWGQCFIVGILQTDAGLGPRSYQHGWVWKCTTITRITTQGRFSDLTISMATDVLPDPELPAIPIILRSSHGGE